MDTVWELKNMCFVMQGFPLLRSCFTCTTILSRSARVVRYREVSAIREVCHKRIHCIITFRHQTIHLGIHFQQHTFTDAFAVFVNYAH